MSTKRDTIADPNTAAAIEALVDVLEILHRKIGHIVPHQDSTEILIKLRTVRAQLRGGETSEDSV